MLEYVTDDDKQDMKEIKEAIERIDGKARAEGRALTPRETKLQTEMRAELDRLLRIPERPQTLDFRGTHEHTTRGLDGMEFPPDALLFETRDGQTVGALPVKRNFADLDRRGLEWKGIGPGSLGRIIRAKILGDSTGLNEHEFRAMGEGTGIGGGYFVPEVVSSYVIDLARAKAVCMQAGAWTLPMTGPEVTLVKVLTDPTAYFVAEHVAIIESDGSFGPITLKAMVLGSLVRVSAALLEDAPTSGRAIEDMLAASLGLKLDKAILLGNGTNEPKGLWACKDINVYSMGANGAAPTSYDAFSYAAQYVLEDNGTPTAVIMAPRTYGTLDRLKQATTNDPLNPPQSYKDMQKFVTNQVPIDQTQGTSSVSSCAFVGDFKNVVVGMRKQITIDVSPTGASDSFAKVEAMVRAYMRVDVAILRENHFTVIKGLL